MDYDLRRLGTREFEHLSQALVLKVLGAGSCVFGDGPDGGREATVTGRATWRSDVGEPEVWDGYIVAQAKFLQSPSETTLEQAWFSRHVELELKHWANQDSKRRKKGRLPEYLLLITNARLSAAEGGGVDAIDELIGKYANKLGLKRWRVWHYAHVCRLLDNAADVRSAFAGLLTPGDVLSQLMDMLQGTPADLGEMLATHAAKDLMNERWVRLSQAGDATSSRLSLEQVAVDLDAQTLVDDVPKRVSTVAHLVEQGDRVLRPSIDAGDSTALFVVVGGPGQGKTTLGQLLTQTYRAALLEHSAARYGQSVEQVVDGTWRSLGNLAVPRPKNLRWPIRIELAAYGDAVSGGADISLFRWISERIKARAPVDVTPAHLFDWLRQWPWLVVLDGLDEVASAHAREQLIERLSDFFVDAASQDADLLVVGTTRPQGYNNEFAIANYKRLDLIPLDAGQAIEYATRLADVRHHHDDVQREDTLARVRQAAAEPLTARLMRTPLQVTIMSLLLERRPRPPQDRHGLFEAYYETIYAREASKPGSLAQLLHDHKGHVNALHNEVGLRLQILAEKEGDAMPRTELEAVVLDRLRADEYGDDAARRLTGELLRATTDRLVLLVPKGADVGFEVRSLQEFMAARALTAGPEEQIMQRLNLIAPAVHWRNTWLLAVGRLFEKDHLRPQIVASLRQVDDMNLLTMLIPAGPGLALDLLDDDLAASSPRHRKTLLAHGLEVLQLPAGAHLDSRAATFNDLAADPTLRPLITGALEQGCVGRCSSRVGVDMVLGRLGLLTGELAAKARLIMGRQDQTTTPHAVFAAWVKADQSNLNRRWLRGLVEPFINLDQLEGDTRRTAKVFLHQLEKSWSSQLRTGNWRDHTLGLGNVPSASLIVRDPVLSDAVAFALSEIPDNQWVAAVLLHGLFREARERMPVGYCLTSSSGWL